MKNLIVIIALVLAGTVILSFSDSNNSANQLDEQLYAKLEEHDFTGKIQQQLEIRLGRKLDKRKIELGRLIFFDKGLGLHQDNSCAGCHAPAFGFGDSQSIAIGVDNNDIVGMNRQGPRNQRRAPSVINTAFFPRLMWNGRFSSLSNDPFDNSLGFGFPPPEGDSLFNIAFPYVHKLKHLLAAQAHIPFTELTEMAGFTNTSNDIISISRFSGLTIMENNNKATPMLFNPIKPTRQHQVTGCPEPDFSVFDDGHGIPVPPVDPNYNSPNFGIRAAVLTLLNNNAEYVALFKKIYPQVPSQPIDFIMVSEVVAEFELFLTFADAPFDKFAAGNRSAMTTDQKKGALVFFGKGNCISCHAVTGSSNQMFSDFDEHNVGTPQIYPAFGAGTGNVPFSDLDCPTKTATGTLDYGLEEFSGLMTDRYKFRSSPLRNVVLQSSFFHNGSFTDLKKAIKFHLDPVHNITQYSPSQNGVPDDLHYKASDMTEVIATIDPLLEEGIILTSGELNDLFLFVRDGLYDKKAAPEKMKKLIPQSVPSGVPISIFENSGSKEYPVGNVAQVTRDSEHIEKGLEAKLGAVILNNPSRDFFTLTPTSASEVNINLLITDVNGQPVGKFANLQRGEVIQFGQNYKQGLFLAFLTQGKDKVTLKLIKL